MLFASNTAATDGRDAADGHHAGFRGTHDILAERPGEKRRGDRTRLARSHLAAGGSPLLLSRSVGDHPSIHPTTLGLGRCLPAAPAEQEISNLSDNNKASHARRPGASNWRGEGGTICHIIRKTMPREGGRRLSSKGALFPIELLTSKRRGGEEGRRGDEKRREGKRRGDV